MACPVEWCTVRPSPPTGPVMRTLDAAGHAACEAAFVAGNGALVDGTDVTELIPIAGAPRALQTPNGSLLRYACAWFYAADGGRWCPLPPATCHLLDEAREAGEARADDNERTYDLRRLTQRNRDSGTVRPLLCVVQPGRAECGPAPKAWVVREDENWVVLYAALSEVLEQQFRSFAAGCALEAPFPHHASAVVDVDVRFTGDGNGGMTLTPGGHAPAPRRLERMWISWLRRADDGSWQPAPVDVARHLSMAVATKHSDYSHGPLHYDLERYTETDRRLGTVRQLMYVRGRGGDSAMHPCRIAELAKAHPAVHERLAAMVDPKASADQLRARVSTRLGFGIAVVNVVLRHGVVVKGGPVRDIAVLGDGEFKDIDAECPGHLTPAAFRAWIDAMIDDLGDTLGATFTERPDGRRFTTRTTCGAVSQQTVQMGAATIDVFAPGDGSFPSVEIELITPWNTDYSPPRNVDFSMNNLRLSADGPGEVGLIVPLGPTLTARYIIDETLRRRTRAVYDAEFVETPCGDGVDGQRTCVAAAPTEARRRRMQGRIEKFRGRGFRFIPLEHF